MVLQCLLNATAWYGLLLISASGKAVEEFESADTNCWESLAAFWGARHAEAKDKALPSCSHTVLPTRLDGQLLVVLDPSVATLWLMNLGDCRHVSWHESKRGCTPQAHRYDRGCTSCELAVNISSYTDVLLYTNDGRSAVHQGQLEALGKRHSSSKPNVYVLVLDSVSRQGMLNLLPKTFGLIAGGAVKQNWTSAYFSGYHSLQAGGTLENWHTVLYGGLLKSAEQIEEPVQLKEQAPEEILRLWTQPNRFINEAAREQGLLTALSATAYGDHTYDTFKRDINAPWFPSMTRHVHSMSNASNKKAWDEFDGIDLKCFAGHTIA